MPMWFPKRRIRSCLPAADLLREHSLLHSQPARASQPASHSLIQSLIQSVTHSDCVGWRRPSPDGLLMDHGHDDLQDLLHRPRENPLLKGRDSNARTRSRV